MAARDSVTLTLAFDLEVTVDPLGADLRVTVTNAPSEDSRQKFLDSAEHTLVGAYDPLVYQAIDDAHDRLESYGSEHDYHVESVVDSFGGVEVDRSAKALHVVWWWDHEAAAFFEFGTSDHTVDGDPLLVFEFDADEYPYLDEMFPEGTAFLPQTEPSGLPEGRWVRDSLNAFRRRLGQ